MQITKGTWHMREQCIPGSLVPRPRPAFRRLQYRKAGRAWYIFLREHDVIGNLQKFTKLTGCVSRMVLVKCRQNVANKLFITCVFNPVRPHTWLTALVLYSDYWTLSYVLVTGRGKLFLSVRYRIYIQYCCSGCWSSWKCWLCGTSSKLLYYVPNKAWLW